MKTKAIVAGAVVLVILLFLTIMLFVSRRPPPPQDITVRHVKSVQHDDDITTMTFEIKNHAATPYSFFANQVQVRNGSTWTNFPVWQFRRLTVPGDLTVGPTGLVYCTVLVHGLPADSVVRFSIRTHKKLLGLSGLFKRAELNLKRGGNFAPSLNPYDTNSLVWGDRTEVTSDEFVETVK